MLEGATATLIAQVRGALTGVDDIAATSVTVTTAPCTTERNDVGFAGFEETSTVTRNDIVSTRDQRQHEARNGPAQIAETVNDSANSSLVLGSIPTVSV